MLPVHQVAVDPGTDWVEDPTPAVEGPPDSALADGRTPDPAVVWPSDGLRTGLAGVVAPNVRVTPDGRLQMFYTQILPRAGFPGGANDYATATTRILSAVSVDGRSWTPEPGVRLSSQQGGAGDSRVACPEVVPVADAPGRLRMYFECAPNTLDDPCSIRSAVSDDGALTWQAEPGDRLAGVSEAYSAPRLVHLDDGTYRLYASLRPDGIVSAISDDGLTFEREPGYRVHRASSYDTVFAPEVLQLDGGGYRMYYGGYTDPTRACILSAVSDDGLAWRKEPEPVLTPGGVFGAAKVSEMCIIAIPGRDGAAERYRMFYEACDGTAAGKRGVWRIMAADAQL